jgi:shikimate dehydrogenase
MPLLDEISDEAAAIGAVNTVAFRGGHSIGHNTDMLGFTEGMRRGLPGVAKTRVLQLGCGGAGAAVAHALLAQLNVSTLVLHDIDSERARLLTGQLIERYGIDRAIQADNLLEKAGSCDGIVNASPVGMAKFPGVPLPITALQRRHWVADIVYFPLETELLREARRKGCETLDGSRMVVHQAAEAFRIMTGREADPERMMRSFASFTGNYPRAVA